MATSTITGTIQSPVGAALPNVRVVCRLLPRPCFETATAIELAPITSTTTNASGIYTFTLVRTADITPADSYYEITEYIPDNYGGPVKHVIQVGAANTSVLASLVSTPPSPSQDVFLTQAAGDARYGPLSYGAIINGSRPNSGGSAGVANTVARSDHLHSRETTYGTAAVRAALTGSDLYEGLTFRETDTGKLYTYRASVWLQVADTLVVANSTARTAISTPYEGMQVYQLDTNTIYSYDGSSWWTTAIVGNGTTAHTSTISQGVSTNIAKTTNYSQYRIISGVCEWWFSYSMTASGTAGSQFTLTLPVTCAFSTVGVTVGNGMIYDASVPTIDTGHYEIVTSTTISLAVGEGVNAPWGASPNLALASGDIIRGMVRFPVSSAA